MKLITVLGIAMATLGAYFVFNKKSHMSEDDELDQWIRNTLVEILSNKLNATNAELSDNSYSLLRNKIEEIVHTIDFSLTKNNKNSINLKVSIILKPGNQLEKLSIDQEIDWVEVPDKIRAHYLRSNLDFISYSVDPLTLNCSQTNSRAK